MPEQFDPVAHNRAAWDREVANDNEWTRPVGPEIVARARAGDWSVVLIGYEPTPRDWFPAVPCAIIEVADHGPGLTQEQATRVFERFYRADQARGRRTGGSGLGLAIVQALIVAHGGTVSLDTAPGQGATFRITLPLAPEALATEGAAD